MPDAWHWSESDVTPWCKSQLETLLQNRRLFDRENVACRTGKVYSVKGEASVSTRRGKQMLVVEFQVQVSWHATVKHPPKAEDGSEAEPVLVNGLMTLPSITEDTINKTDVEIALDPGQPETPQASQVLGVVRKFGKEAMHNVVLQFWADIREKFGKASVENKVVDEASERQQLGRALVQWMQAHMFTEVRREWTSRKAIALRTLITGLMTASGSIMVGGPVGLIAATAVFGGGFGGYKGYRRQLDSFHDFTEAFMGSDHILLVEMATRFVLSSEAAGLQKEHLEEWIADKKNLRNLILWYCKELSEDDPGELPAPADAIAAAATAAGTAAAAQAAGPPPAVDADQPLKRRYLCCNPASLLKRGVPGHTAATPEAAAGTAAAATDSAVPAAAAASAEKEPPAAAPKPAPAAVPVPVPAAAKQESRPPAPKEADAPAKTADPVPPVAAAQSSPTKEPEAF